MPYTDPAARRAYDQKRYAENKLDLNRKQKKYYEDNREARLAYIRDYSKRRVEGNVELVRQLKSKPCMDCHGNFHFAAMDFDHRPGEGKVANITYLMRSQRTSRKNLLAEIAKCDLVCSNCHRVRTYQRNQDHVETTG